MLREWVVIDHIIRDRPLLMMDNFPIWNIVRSAITFNQIYNPCPLRQNTDGFLVLFWAVMKCCCSLHLKIRCPIYKASLWGCWNPLRSRIWGKGSSARRMCGICPEQRHIANVAKVGLSNVDPVWFLLHLDFYVCNSWGGQQYLNSD